jgi:nitrous oxidase accessory protein
VFRGSLVGANIMNSRRLTLERNEFIRNRGITAVGLSLKDCDASTVSQNRFSGNARGLQLDGSSSNTIVGNRFTQNDVAVRLLASSERNTFSANVFLHNWSDVVESGTDTTTAWSLAGIGNRWSRYSGFDFDGDGVGESPHPLLRPFEQVEASNELARLYLQSPAAGALDLAARSASRARAGSTDPYPLTGTPQGPAKAGHYVLGPAKAGHYVLGPAKAGHYVLGPAEAGHYVLQGGVRLEPDRHFAAASVAGVFMLFLLPIARRARRASAR